MAAEPGSLSADVAGVLRHGRKAALALVGVGVALWLASGIYSVKPEQRGVVKRFGKVVDADVTPGIHYRWPWPVESVERPRTTEIQTLVVDFAESEGDAGALLTGDENLVLARLHLQYTIKKPADFLHATADAPALLALLARDAAVARFARTDVDLALTSGWQEIQVALREEVQAAADKCGLGVRVAALQIGRVDPPKEVAPAFKEVASAREDKQKLVEEADGERNRQLPQARAQAERLRNEAEGRAAEAVSMARGDAERFLSAWQEYRKAPSVTARRLYLEALEEALPRVKKLIVSEKAEGRVGASMR